MMKVCSTSKFYCWSQLIQGSSCETNIYYIIKSLGSDCSVFDNMLDYQSRIARSIPHLAGLSDETIYLDPVFIWLHWWWDLGVLLVGSGVQPFWFAGLYVGCRSIEQHIQVDQGLKWFYLILSMTKMQQLFILMLGQDGINWQYTAIVCAT